MCQGCPGDRGWLRQLLQDPFQVLGDLGEGSTSAWFHLMGGNRDSFTQCSSKRRSLHFPPTTWSRKALPTDGWGWWAGRKSEALTLQQWMARSRKGRGQSSPTRVRKAGTSRPKSCRNREAEPSSLPPLGSPSDPQSGPQPPGNPPWLRAAQSGAPPFQTWRHHSPQFGAGNPGLQVLSR